ncbi:DUF202 domain-containing protein [Ideonella azotifigens]|nr:DUF202 domain-containing protein [Ideonella azotifigens]MCD2342927.1 DUF202 domain-containing protein [Ideonella azotifigens]
MARLFDSRWRGEGKDPDYRYTLANERTFLAWIRTAMAVLGSGVVLEQFSSHLGPRAWVLALACFLTGLAAVMSIGAYWQWRRNEIAMRHERALPSTRSVLVLAAGFLITAGVITLMLATA